MRLQVFLSHNGVCSRRDAMEIIQSGRVKVNGSIIREPSMPVDGSEDITVDGQKVGKKAYTYVMLHKPAGYTTTKDDPYAEKIVMDLLPSHLRHLAPVGRLDRDTEGLLLLTNDGTWAQALTHPKFHLEKTYRVTIKGKLEAAVKKRMEAGMDITVDERAYHTAPCTISDCRYNEPSQETQLTMKIHEGKKRQIRTMFYTVKHKVTYLKRVAIGSLGLGELKLGQWRELKLKEIKSIGNF